MTSGRVVAVLAASLVAGTACAWLCLMLGFRRFQAPGWESPAGPLALGLGAIAYLAGPWWVARVTGRRAALALVGLAALPLAVLAWALVLPDVRA